MEKEINKNKGSLYEEFSILTYNDELNTINGYDKIFENYHEISDGYNKILEKYHEISDIYDKILESY